MKSLGHLAAAAALVFAASGVARAQTPPAPAPAPPPQPGQIDASQLSKIPKLTKFVEAEYPAAAVAKDVEADVVLLLDIDDKGSVTGVTVLEPAAEAGYGFDEAATAAAFQFVFEPAEMNGKPVPVQLSYRYKFRMKAKAPATQPEAPATQPTPDGGPPPAAPAAPEKKPVVNYSGRLIERGTRAPLSGVTVTVFRDTDHGREGFEATSDADGHFEFFDLAVGEWKVLVESPGYYPYRTAEEITATEVTQVLYYVEKGSYNPFDVTVTAERPRKEVNRVQLQRDVIDKVPGTAGDPLAVVQNLPGVARTGVGPFSGQIIVRGSAPEDTVTVVDGIEVPLIYHFGGLRSVIPLGMLDGIEFIPGNFSTEYSRATGGIVNVQVKSPKAKRLTGYADVSILDTSVYLEAPLTPKLSIAVGGRRSYLDAVLNAAVPDDAAVSLTTAPVYYDYQALVEYRPTTAHTLRAFFFGSDDKLELLFKNPADLSTQIDADSIGNHTQFYRGILSYKYVPDESFENSVRLGAGHDQIFFGAGPITFDLDLYLVQLRDTARWKLSDVVTLVGGIDATWGHADGLVRAPAPPKEGDPSNSTPGEPDFSKTLESTFSNSYAPSGVFADAELTPVKGMLISAGLRADYFQRVKQFALEPRLTARYALPETDVSLKGGVGLFYEEPQYDETDPVFGNPDLKAERAIHYSLGAEWKPLPYLLFDGTAFYKDMSSLVSGTDATRMEGDKVVPLTYDNNGIGRVVGFELLVRHDFSSNFMGWIAYTLSRSERKDSGTSEYRLFDFDQTHILTLVATYKLPRNWEASGRFRFVSGNPRTPVVGSTYDASRDVYQPIYGETNSDRNGAFHQLDLRLDKKWIYDRWMLNFYVDLQNVYDRANPEGLQYNYDFTKNTVQGGLPILTIVGLKAEL
jgi:TonB family protein